MSAIFVSATGTDIGKTFVAAGLIRHLRETGRPVDAIKPVVSGFDPAQAAASDPGTLLAALGRPTTSDEIARIAPWRYALPAAPDLAARKEGRTLDYDALLNYCGEAAIASSRGTLLIEGVGGIMVPLDERRTVLDWMAALDLPVLVVTGSYLGTISHTLTCLEVLQARRLTVLALVVNETPGSTVSIEDTAKTLARFIGPIPLVMLPRLAGAAPQHEAFAKIAALL